MVCTGACCRNRGVVRGLADCRIVGATGAAGGTLDVGAVWKSSNSSSPSVIGLDMAGNALFVAACTSEIVPPNASSSIPSRSTSCAGSGAFGAAGAGVGIVEARRGPALVGDRELIEFDRLGRVSSSPASYSWNPLREVSSLNPPLPPPPPE